MRCILICLYILLLYLKDVGEECLLRNKNTEMSHLMTKPTMWFCAQRRLRSSAQSDQSLRCPHEESLDTPPPFSYPLSAQRRLWSDWADAQADLSLRWAHTHFVGFVTRRLKWLFLFSVTRIISLLLPQWLLLLLFSMIMMILMLLLVPLSNFWHQ